MNTRVIPYNPGQSINECFVITLNYNLIITPFSTNSDSFSQCQSFINSRVMTVWAKTSKNSNYLTSVILSNNSNNSSTSGFSTSPFKIELDNIHLRRLPRRDITFVCVSILNVFRARETKTFNIVIILVWSLLQYLSNSPVPVTEDRIISSLPQSPAAETNKFGRILHWGKALLGTLKLLPSILEIYSFKFQRRQISSAMKTEAFPAGPLSFILL